MTVSITNYDADPSGSRLSTNAIQAAIVDLLAQRHRKIHFHIRVDAASQYATNLLFFLHHLLWSKAISIEG